MNSTVRRSVALFSLLSIAAVTSAQQVPTTAPTTATAVQIDEAKLAAREPFFARLLQERDNLAIELSRLEQTRGANHPAIVKTREQLKVINAQIAAIATQLTKNATPSGLPTTLPASEPASGR